ncbi:hypothetical protein MAR_017065 [Mya arenaria]|uniref:C-type lectin domain-containing protein n=1 Tax=Mya arenaria TaxID=6604 RepID=A0ABY7EE82_MYAAR|nr:hypothetical protein MAR_017065 [Mya arenaria]
MKGWKEYAGVCYKVSAGAFNWTSGDEHCKDVGGSLATFNGVVLNFLRNMVSELLSNDTPVWIAMPENQVGCYYLQGAGGAFSTTPCEEEHRVGRNFIICNECGKRLVLGGASKLTSKELKAILVANDLLLYSCGTCLLPGGQNQDTIVVREGTEGNV